MSNKKPKRKEKGGAKKQGKNKIDTTLFDAMSMEELQDHIKIKEEEIKDIQKGNAAASINHECQNKSLKEKEKSLELVARQICEMNENIKQTKAKQAVEVQILQDRLKFLLFHNKILKDEIEIEYDDRMADEEEHKDNRMKCLLQEKETLKHLIENDRKEHHRLLQERNVYYQQQKQEKEQQLQKNLDDAKDECKERIFRTQNEIQIQIHNNENEMTEKMNSFLRESKDKQREVMNKTMKYYNEILAENIRIIDVLKEQIKHKQMTLDEKRRENQNLRIENEKLITPIETINEENSLLQKQIKRKNIELKHHNFTKNQIEITEKSIAKIETETQLLKLKPIMFNPPESRY